MSRIHKPNKNKFVPESIETIVKPEERLPKNLKPNRINIDYSHKIVLYHLLDRVYLKPRTSIDIVLRLR